ncbi:MAG: hotdog fold thioesterase [Cyclonatronaceae bacterium]
MKIEKELKLAVSAFLENQPQNMGHALGIEFTELFRNRVCATMPVNENTKQPMGLLHGGASVALGETICSVAGWLNLKSDAQTAVGLEINANHVRAVRSGVVKGVATPIHRGSQTQVWKYDIFTSDDKLVCTGRCTLAIVGKSRG